MHGYRITPGDDRGQRVVEASSYSVDDVGSLILLGGDEPVEHCAAGDWLMVDEIGCQLCEGWPPSGLELSSVIRGWTSLALGALLLLTACSSNDYVSRPTYRPLSSTPQTIGAEQGDPSTTVDNGQHVFVIREVCASDDTPCPALSFGGAVYIQGGWPLNRRAVQALGDELGVSQDGAEVRALFSIDTVVAYRSSPEGRWQALVAAGATHEPANEWLLCSVLATPNPAWITCEGYDLSAAGLTGHWMGTAEQVVDAVCAELPQILRRRSENAVEAGSRDEPMFYAVAALIDARWIDLGCEGHLMLP